MTRMDVLTNNLANALTPGYKAMRPVFHEVLAEKTSDAKDAEDLPDSSTVSTSTDYSQAPLANTGEMLNLAIEGPGFFVISAPGGPRYTRNGQFALDKDKGLVTNSGYPVSGEAAGKIFINGRMVRIDTDGSVFVDGIRVNRIKVVDFTDRESLQRTGAGLFTNIREENPEITPKGYSVRQGFIEMSNVSVTREMIDLINCTRAYEAYKKATRSVEDAEDRLFTISRTK